MTDITTTKLAAAVIDQKVAGAFRGKTYAFVAVMDRVGAWQLGVAVEDEPGYNPIEGKAFDTREEATLWANGLNDHIGLSNEDAARIITTTMRRPH